MHDQQISPQTFCEIDCRSFAIAFWVLVSSAHEDFLKPSVVEIRLRLWGHRDADVIHIGLAEHRVQGVRAAAAPTPDTDARRINEGTSPSQLLHTSRLFFRR